MRRLFIPFVIAALFGSSAWAFAPDVWLKNLFGGDRDRLAPKYQDLEFWDFDEQRMRGIRAFFYTLPQERENRLIDMRLHTFMTQFLSQICSEVITLESFENDETKLQVENTVVELVDQWKLRNQIDSAAFFNAIPMIDVDLVIFLERTAYEQTWRREDKLLLIGFNLAAFEMDLGRPVYSERHYQELPWFSDTSSHQKAEQNALLKAADELGLRLRQVTSTINELHEEEVRQAEIQAKLDERARVEEQRDEYRQLQRLVELARQAIDGRERSDQAIGEIEATLSQLEPLMRSAQLPPEEADRRRELAFGLQSLLSGLMERERAQAAAAQAAMQSATPEQAQVESATPVFPVDGLEAVDWRSGPGSSPAQMQRPAAPRSPYSIDDPFDRRWLVPGRSAEAGSIGDSTP